MLIGILSDSHDNVPYLYKAVEIFNQKQVSHVFHAGDFVSAFTAKPFMSLKCKFTGVFGNNDGDKLLIEERFKDIGIIHDNVYKGIIDGKRIILIHREDLIEEFAQSGRYDIIIYGHTHKIDIRQGPPLIINPGECGGWLFNNPTVVILDTEKLEVEILKL